MTDHKFGGGWTQIKLDVLRDYLHFYTQALKNQKFKLHYIDAFAGSGECLVKTTDGHKKIDGSAKIALETSPSFHHFHFIENHGERFKALKALCDDRNDESIDLYRADATETLDTILQSIDWRNSRAVLFLDPYGMEVKWHLLEKVAATKAIDMWFLFSISGLCRQAARSYEAVDEHKEQILDECLGTPDWRTAFYEESSQMTLWGTPPTERTAEIDDLLQFVQRRLKSIFAEVPKPLILPRSGPPLFALFFAVSNPRAVGLSMKAANHILSKDW
jgi:three-Cys-motif partner protein